MTALPHCRGMTDTTESGTRPRTDALTAWPSGSVIAVTA